MKNFEKPPVRIRQIEGTPPQFRSNELARLATTYADVFAGNPWREVSRCKDGFSPESVGSQCEECGETRSEAYPLGPQMETISTELSRPSAACFVVEDEQDDSIVGFSWGFAYENIEELLAEKYDGTTAEYRQLQDDVRRTLGRYGIGARAFYYLSETGIIDDFRYRGRGISKELVRRRQDVAEGQGLNIVQRTSIQSPMFRTMRSAGFTQVMGENIGLPDVINADRVLFVKKQSREE